MSGGRRIFRLGDEAYEVESFVHGDQVELHGNPNTSFTFRRMDGDRIEVVSNGEPIRARFFRDGDVLWLHAGGKTHRFEVEVPGRSRAHGAAATRDDVLAPMTGTVREVRVTAGDQVSLGDPVIVMEAMKMEHVLKAPRDGVVAEIRCEAGAQAEAQSVLLRLEATES